MLKRILFVATACAPLLAWACSSFSGSNTSSPEDAGSDATSDDDAPSDAANGDAAKDGAAGSKGDASTDAAFDASSCASQDQCAPSFLVGGLNHPASIALDLAAHVSEKAIGGHVYNVDKVMGTIHSIEYTGDYLGPLGIGAGTVFVLLQSGAVHAIGGNLTPVTSLTSANRLAADDAGILLSTSGTAFALISLLTMSNAETGFVPTGVITSEALGDSDIYFTIVTGTPISIIHVQRNNIGILEDSADAFMSASNLVLLQDALYFIDQSNARVASLALAQFTKGGATVDVATHLTAPRLLTTDGKALYLVDSNAIFRITLSNLQKDPIVTGVPNISALAVDDQFVYYTVEGTLDGGAAEDAGYLTRHTK